jgi:hypothetical protein
MRKYIEELSKTAAQTVAEQDLVTKTEFAVVVASAVADEDLIKKVLIASGIPAVSVEKKKGVSVVSPAIGDNVELTQEIQASKDILIKTPTTLYNVPKVDLPLGYIGEVVGVDKNAANVKFEANIRVVAYDQSGNQDFVDYFVDTVVVPLDKLIIR